MRESTRIYSRMVSNFLLACVSVIAYFQFGEILWLVIGLCSGGFAAFWLMRARSVGDALAPPLTNPNLVKRLAMLCGTAGGILLMTMLWRMQGQWSRLVEPENLWLGLACIVMIGIAVFAPVELRSARPRG